jgi:hypothetical protein
MQYQAIHQVISKTIERRHNLKLYEKIAVRKLLYRNGTLKWNTKNAHTNWSTKLKVETCERSETDSYPIQEKPFFFVIPFYLQSVLVHSENCVKKYTMACTSRRVLTSTPLLTNRFKVSSGIWEWKINIYRNWNITNFSGMGKKNRLKYRIYSKWNTIMNIRKLLWN